MNALYKYLYLLRILLIKYEQEKCFHFEGDCVCESVNMLWASKLNKRLMNQTNNDFSSSLNEF